MPYVIWDTGWMAVDSEYLPSALLPGQSLVEEVPQSLIDLVAASEAEAVWREGEMPFIAAQLQAFDDGDPAALPGTEREWRDYRIGVRAWVAGAPGYPSGDHRPIRPS